MSAIAQEDLGDRVAATAAVEPIVAARGLVRRYGTGPAAVEAVRGVSLDVPPGELVADHGPVRLRQVDAHAHARRPRPPDEGEAWIDGVEISTPRRPRADPAAPHAHRLRLPVLQPAADAHGGENIVLPLSIAGAKPDRAWVDELVRTVGLDDRLSHRPAQLSGGQQQRVAIARALVSRPAVLFADEPTGNLDSRTSGEILDLMRGSVDRYGQTTVMVTHDSRAATIADRILFLADGPSR